MDSRQKSLKFKVELQLELETRSRFRAALGFGQKESMALHPVSGWPVSATLYISALISTLTFQVLLLTYSFCFSEVWFPNGFNLAWFWLNLWHLLIYLFASYFGSHGKLCFFFQIRESLVVPFDLFEPAPCVLGLLPMCTWLSLDGGIHSS